MGFLGQMADSEGHFLQGERYLCVRFPGRVPPGVVLLISAGAADLLKIFTVDSSSC